MGRNWRQNKNVLKGTKYPPKDHLLTAFIKAKLPAHTHQRISLSFFFFLDVFFACNRIFLFETVAYKEISKSNKVWTRQSKGNPRRVKGKWKSTLEWVWTMWTGNKPSSWNNCQSWDKFFVVLPMSGISLGHRVLNFPLLLVRNFALKPYILFFLPWGRAEPQIHM